MFNDNIWQKLFTYGKFPVDFSLIKINNIYIICLVICHYEVSKVIHST